MKRIISVSANIPSFEDEDYFHITENGSLSDADIAIFDTNINELFSDSEKHKGTILLNEETSKLVRDSFEYWKKEIEVFLKAGKTVFILLEKVTQFLIYTGDERVDGIGSKNVHTIKYTTEINNYGFIPFKSNIINSSGKIIYPFGNTIKKLFDFSKQYFAYEVYLENEDFKNCLLTTKNKDKILGANIGLFSGNIIFLPKLKFPENFSIKGGEYWSKKAFNWGRGFTNNLIEFDNLIKVNNEKSLQPEWMNNEDIKLKNAIIIENNLNIIDKRIEKLNNKKVKLKESLENINLIKDLLFESGKPLENAVLESLRILGYSAENYNDGELEIDQVIISPEGDRFIGECEGKDNKDIDITKFRQLHDIINQDFEREDVSEKAFGLLFGNPQRFIKIYERTLDFTEKCKKAAKRESIGLIKTSDLFFVVKYLIENNDDAYKEKCRLAIKNQLGSIIKFPDLP